MNSKLTDTLGLLYDMELNNYFTVKSIEKIKKEIEGLGKPQEVTKAYISYRSSFVDSVMGGAFISGIVGLIGGAVLGLFGYTHFEWYDSIFFLPVVAVIAGLAFAVIGAVIIALVSIPSRIREEKSFNDRVEKEEERYEKALLAEEKRLKSENNAKQYLLSEQKALENRLAAGTKKLNEFYSIIGIADGYRNLVAMSHMYEYAQLGISTQLEGVDGLYFLIKKEIQAEKLQYSLEEISRKMDTIIDKQDSIYRQLQAMNSKCDAMIAETRRTAEKIVENNQMLRQIEYNSSVAAYNTQRIEKEMNYQNYILKNYQ